MEFFATSQSIPVHISDSKSGNTPILLLHGYLETMYIWEEFIDLLDPEFRVISIDLPGHGLSGSFAVNTMELMADVVKDVLDICGVPSVYVAGHSMGGYVSLKFAERYPDRCNGLILLNSNPFADSEGREKDRLREIEIIRADKLVYLAQSSIPKMYATVNLRALDDKVQETIEMCETHDPEGIISTIRGMMLRNDMQDFLKKFDKKLIMVFGDSDKFMGIDQVRSLIAEYPNAQTYILEETGHNSFIENPVRTAEIINGILG